MERLRATVVFASIAISCGGARPDAASAPSAPATSASVSPVVRLNLGDVVWNDAGPRMPPGAKVAVLEGDPKKESFFTMRLKLPPGARLPPHTHPADERVTVISGSVHLGFGEKFDTSKDKTITAGGFYVNPTPMPHFLWTDEECVLQVTGVGPWRLTPVDAAP
jgi:quercetin dioxygenase-like cupin family protein